MELQSSYKKRKNQKINYETRLQLLKRVQLDGETIKKAAKCLNIKQSTAKLIVSRFRTSGTIYETKRDFVIRTIKKLSSGRQESSVAQNQPTLVKSENEEQQDQSYNEIQPPYEIIPARYQPVMHSGLPFSYSFIHPFYFPQ